MAATTVVVSPVYLVGAQAVQIGADLGLSPGSLGLTVSVFFAFTALSSAVLGRAVQRHGVRRGLVAVALGSGLAFIGLAMSRSVFQLAIFLGLAGVSNGAVHPASNALLATGTAGGRLGLSVGAKQAAPLAASLLSGLAVPLIAVTVGWRWSFVGALVGSAFLLRAVLSIDKAPRAAAPPRTTPPYGERHLVLVTAVAAAIGAAAGSSLGTFAVDFGVRSAGMAEATAGLAFALASLVGLGGRLLWGWVADRPWAAGPHPLAVALLLVGSVGFALIGTSTPLLFVVGASLASGLGWAWPGLLHFAVVARDPWRSAGATGVLMTGFATGSFLGPIVLGQLAQRLDYVAVWVMAASLNVTAAIVLAAGRRRRRRE